MKLTKTQLLLLQAAPYSVVWKDKRPVSLPFKGFRSQANYRLVAGGMLSVKFELPNSDNSETGRYELTAAGRAALDETCKPDPRILSPATLEAIEANAKASFTHKPWRTVRRLLDHIDAITGKAAE